MDTHAYVSRVVTTPEQSDFYNSLSHSEEGILFISSLPYLPVYQPYTALLRTDLGGHHGQLERPMVQPRSDIVNLQVERQPLVKMIIELTVESL